MKSLTIGKIKLKNPIILAPMVDVTDLPYRIICKKAGASLVYTEMLYVDAILHKNQKTIKLMQFMPKEKPIGIQITGNKLEEFRKAIPYLKKYDLVDINCGCPSARITGNEAGSYLLKNPEKIADIIKMLKSAGLTVTAKIRLGFNNNNVLSVAKIIEKAGADAITIHARLAWQSNKIPADWSWIAKVKKNVKIPVIGNGDIKDGKSASEMLKITDGAMIARAAIGDPLIFERIITYLKTGIEPGFDLNKNIQSLQYYISLAKKYEFNELARIKYLSSNFLRNFKGAARLRQELMQKKTFEEIEDFVKNINLKTSLILF